MSGCWVGLSGFVAGSPTLNDCTVWGKRLSLLLPCCFFVEQGSKQRMGLFLLIQIPDSVWHRININAFPAIVHCGKSNLKRSYRTPALEALSHPLSQPRESRAYSPEPALFPQYSTHLCNQSSPWAVQEVGAATPVFSLFRALRFGVGLAGIAGFPQPTLGSSCSQVWRLLCAL